MRVQDDYHNTAIWRGSVDYLKWVGKSCKKWGLQPLSNPSNYLRERVCTKSYFNSLSANPTKWPNIVKQFVGKLSTNCLSVFNHFVGLAYKVQFLYTIYSVQEKDNVKPENITKFHQMNLLRSFSFKSCICKFRICKNFSLQMIFLKLQ